jgi:hypothetical protein
LASIDDQYIGNLDVRVYTSKTDQPSIYCEHNGQKLSWKLDYNNDIKPLVKTTVKKAKDASGKVVDVKENDYFDVNEKFLQIFREQIGNKIDPKKRITSKPAATPVAQEELVTTEEDDLGLPF